MKGSRAGGRARRGKKGGVEEEVERLYMKRGKQSHVNEFVIYDLPVARRKRRPTDRPCCASFEFLAKEPPPRLRLALDWLGLQSGSSWRGYSLLRLEWRSSGPTGENEAERERERAMEEAS